MNNQWFLSMCLPKDQDHDFEKISVRFYKCKECGVRVYMKEGKYYLLDLFNAKPIPTCSEYKMDKALE